MTAWQEYEIEKRRAAATSGSATEYEEKLAEVVKRLGL